MGSPLSPAIADLVLQDLERKALDLLKISLPFYIRYVDDIAMDAPQGKMQDNSRLSIRSILDFN